MLTRHRKQLVAFWLLGSALLTVILFLASRTVLEQAIREQLQAHLLLTLDEAQFGNAQDRENDKRALQRMGAELNTALRDLVVTHWYSAQLDCAVQVRRIDGVDVVEAPAGHRIVFSLPRNQIEREVVVGASCAPNYWLAAAISALLGLLFIGINRVFPQPLSRVHQRWLGYLIERNYGETQAVNLLRGYDKTDLDLNPAQLAALEQLHDPGQGNFAWALEFASSDRVAALQCASVDWFVLGLRANPGDLASALQLATAEDSVAIDLNGMTLQLRGLNVSVSGTPLFYYAWYAMARQRGEGWITNPATNRPDPAAGRELIALMSRYDGHARAINDLERAGLKARTLDQNRSKIKDEIVAALGDTLAETYLFEASKHPDGLHTRYRLRLPGQQIRLVGPA